MDPITTARDVAGQVAGARSWLARRIDANPRKTAAVAMVAAFPLAVGLVTIIGWFV